jgi:hypothetical protein
VGTNVSEEHAAFTFSLKNKAVCYTETLIPAYKSTRHQNPADQKALFPYISFLLLGLLSVSFLYNSVYISSFSYLSFISRHSVPTLPKIITITLLLCRIQHGIPFSFKHGQLLARSLVVIYCFYAFSRSSDDFLKFGTVGVEVS